MFFSFSVFAERYQLTCIDTDNFLMNILIDENERTIFHLNSYNPSSKKEYIVNEYYEIIEWRSNSHILHFANSDADNMPGITLTNLEEKKQYYAGFYKGARRENYNIGYR